MTFTLRLNSAYGQEGEGPELPGLSAYWNLNSMLSSKYLPGSSTMSTTDCKIDPGGITGKAWPGFCKYIITRVKKSAHHCTHRPTPQRPRLGKGDKMNWHNSGQTEAAIHQGCIQISV